MKKVLKKKQTPEERKAKARWARIFRTYGITKEQYEELDHGFCPICLGSWSDTKRPCVDHNHKTGQVRGLLCAYCNRYRVGHFHDVDVVQRIVDYLRLSLASKWIVPPKPKKRRRTGLKKRKK